MSISDLIVYLYIVTFIIGAVLATFLFVLAKRKNNEFYKYLRNFNVAFLFYVLFEFSLYYIVALNIRGTILITFSFLSDIFYYAFVVSWVFVLESAYENFHIVNKKALIFVTCLCFIVVKLIIICGIDVFYINKFVLIGINVGYNLFLLYCGIRYTIHGFVQIRQEKRSFIFAILSFGFALYMLWILHWDINLIRIRPVNPEDLTIVDPIIAIYILVCIGVILYMYKKDIPSKVNYDISIEEILTQISDKYDLTERQTEVLRLIYEGYNNDEIADELFISKYTVKKHVNSILKKTGSKNRYELVLQKDSPVK